LADRQATRPRGTGTRETGRRWHGSVPTETIKKCAIPLCPRSKRDRQNGLAQAWRRQAEAGPGLGSGQYVQSRPVAAGCESLTVDLDELAEHRETQRGHPPA